MDDSKRECGMRAPPSPTPNPEVKPSMRPARGSSVFLLDPTVLGAAQKRKLASPISPAKSQSFNHIEVEMRDRRQASARWRPSSAYRRAEYVLNQYVAASRLHLRQQYCRSPRLPLSGTSSKAAAPNCSPSSSSCSSRSSAVSSRARSPRRHCRPLRPLTAPRRDHPAPGTALPVPARRSERRRGCGVRIQSGDRAVGRVGTFPSHRRTWAADLTLRPL